jgi:membrane-associated phospholipid phosphatase
LDNPHPLSLKAARVISDVISPPVVSAVMALVVVLTSAPDGETAFIWALVYIGLVCVLPALFVVFMVAAGRITDVHVRLRRQRILPFSVSILCTAAAWLILRQIDAGLLTGIAAITLVEIIVLLVVTLVWQISVHAMTITTAVVIAWLVFGWMQALLLAPLIPIVSAARVLLRRHTVAQVIAGSIVGAAITLWLYAMMFW